MSFKEQQTEDWCRPFTKKKVKKLLVAVFAATGDPRVKRLLGDVTTLWFDVPAAPHRTNRRGRPDPLHFNLKFEGREQIHVYVDDKCSRVLGINGPGFAYCSRFARVAKRHATPHAV